MWNDVPNRHCRCTVLVVHWHAWGTGLWAHERPNWNPGGTSPCKSSNELSGRALAGWFGAKHVTRTNMVPSSESAILPCQVWKRKAIMESEGRRTDNCCFNSCFFPLRSLSSKMRRVQHPSSSLKGLKKSHKKRTLANSNSQQIHQFKNGN